MSLWLPLRIVAFDHEERRLRLLAARSTVRNVALAPRKQAPVPDQLVGLVHLLTLHHCARATMKNVALSHGKRWHSR